jgi:small-conductance mechanosensitive channel
MNSILLIAKGIARDQTVRRSAMFMIILAAIVLLFLGSTLLSEFLAEHVGIFLVYWFACGWLTLTAILMSIYDLLCLRAQARRERAEAKRQIFGDDQP